jgi:hypothetical protein
LLLVKTEAIPDPFEQAFFLMVQLPYLQPCGRRCEHAEFQPVSKC